VRDAVVREIATARDRGRDALGDLKGLDDQIADREGRVNNLIPQLELGGAVEKKVRERLTALNEDIARLQSERRKLADARARRRGDAQHYAAAAARFARAYELATPAERKQLVRAFIHSVEIDIEKRMVRVNYLSLR
jgi:septal ring factor EnvC (AmiA/AmiB activator)